MKKYLSIAVLSLHSTAWAHSGSILSTPSKVNSEINEDGTELVTIENNVIPAEEIKVMTSLKKFLGKKYGDKALKWPLMLFIKSGYAQILNEEKNEYFKVVLKDIGQI